jgi:hypothetical protein
VRIERINCGINQSGHFISFFYAKFRLASCGCRLGAWLKSQLIRYPSAHQKDTGGNY